MAWLLNAAYFLLLAAVSPILAWRALVHGKYRTGWNEKLWGRVPFRSGDRPCVWLHAVSVGEVLQLEPVLAELAQRLPAAEFVISTTTATGRQVALTKYPRHTVCYFPLDFSWAVRAAVRRIRPTAIVLVELELWPNFILHARRLGIPLALINGRVSEKSSRGYSRIRPLMTRLLGSFETLAVQNHLYADRLARLGAPPSRLHVTGSIKFDRVLTNRANPKTSELARAFLLADTDSVFVAGSTQYPEESYALDTYLALRPRFPRLRLILVPRHKERFDEVAALVQSRGLPLLRRSRLAPHSPSTALADGPKSSCAIDGPPSEPAGLSLRADRWDEPTGSQQIPGAPGIRERSLSAAEPPVLLLDTLGELAACWGLADVAFVGGSLTNRGGQNMIEPAGFGAALLFGPNTHNFRDVVELLLAEQAAQVVETPAALTSLVGRFLTDPETARQHGARARRIVLSQQGATTRTVDLIAKLPCFADAHAEAA